MMLIVFLINATSLYLLIRNKLPQSFPWLASAALGFVLLFSGLTSGKIERAVAFITLLSSFIITINVLHFISNETIKKIFTFLSVTIVIFMLVDALRIIPTPDISLTDGEIFGFIRRPYLFEHPNLKASWLILMSASTPITVAGIVVAQSRGALLGYLASWFRFISSRFYIHAGLAVVSVLLLAALVRPNTFFGRIDLWLEAITIFSNQPITGSGTGTYIESSSGMATAHNAALTIAVENGLVGFIVFGAWVIGMVKLIFKSDHTMKYNLLAFSIQQIVDDQWLHLITAIILGIVLAICISKKKVLTNDR